MQRVGYSEDFETQGNPEEKNEVNEIFKVEVKCKMLKADIHEMISVVKLDDVGLLQALQDAIINAQAEYYYSQLVVRGLLKDQK